jgi:hypothetical protein
MYRCTNRGQQLYQRANERPPEKSSARDPWRHSLFHLARLVRNQVYTETLPLDVEIRIFPTHTTTVRGLVLLRTCKQLYNRVAELFYASNTFSCYVQKVVPVQDASVQRAPCPPIESVLDCHTLRDARNIVGGIFFPAAPYHKYLTHLIICFNLTIARFDFSSSDDFMPIFARPGGETGLTGADIAKMHHTVQHKLRRVYQRIKHCWCEKAVRWTGKLVHTMASKLDKYAGITK